MVQGDEFVERLGFGSEEVFGYLYSGALLGLLWWKIRPDEVTKFASSVGGIEFALGVLLLGAGVYAFYFRVIGDFLLFPLQHRIHRIIDRVLRRPSTSPVALMAELGAPVGRRRDAFNEAKDHYLEGDARRRTSFNHAEMQILYITATQLMGAAVVCLLTDSSYRASSFFAAGVAAFMAAVAADTKQHVRVRTLLLNDGPDPLRAFLLKEGLIPGPRASQPPTTAGSTP